MDHLTKTSRDIRGALQSAIKRGFISINYMAHDTKQSPQAVTNHQHTMDASPAAAVKDAEYLDDPLFNSQMAAIFFESVAMFDTKQWSSKFQDSPFATWWTLRDIERERLALGDEVGRFLKEPRKNWTDEQNAKSIHFMEMLLKTISLGSLLAKQLEEVVDNDLVKMIHDFNEQQGNLGGD